MSNPVTFQINAHALWRAIEEHHRRFRKSYQDMFMIAAKGVAAKAVRLTPPFKWQRGAEKEIETDKQARQRGVQNLEIAVNQLFTSSLDLANQNGLKEPQTEADQKANSALADMYAYHQQHRNKYGRVPKAHKPIRWVTKTAKENYAKKARKRIGYLASGWIQGAQKIQVSLPSWVKKHKGPGTTELQVSYTRLYFRMTNNVGFPTKDSFLAKQIRVAVQLETKALLKQLVHKTKKRVKL